MEKKRILVVVIAGIGDVVLASRGLLAIRKGHPDAELHLVTSTDALPIADRYPFVDRVWGFPIRELRKNRRAFRDVLVLGRTLRRLRFDVVINLYAVESLPGALKMGLFLLLVGGREAVGHDSCGFGLFLTGRVPQGTFRNRHFADAMLDIAIRAGGVPDTAGGETLLAMRAGEKDSGSYPGWEQPAPLTIGFNPGGDRENRRWPPAGWAKLGDRLIKDQGARIVLLGGPSETAIASMIEEQMRGRPVNLAGKLSLDDLVDVLGRVDFLVTNDSGPMHIGAMLGTPLVAIFGPEDPLLMGPCARPDLYRVVCKELSCRPCRKAACDSRECLKRITPDDVYGAFLDIRDSRDRLRPTSEAILDAGSGG
jgi:heptosyltransferase II